jgi:hypothetical protein
VQQKQFDRALILKIVLVTEGALFLISMVWSKLAHIDLQPAFSLHGRQLAVGLGAGVLLSSVSTAIYLISLKLPFRWSKKFCSLIAELAEKFAEITVLDSLIIAVVSGFCEEVFFRGVLQEGFGLFGASALFGIMHGPGSLQYGLWAFAAGMFLGWLYIWSHSLWAPITAHVVNNVIGLLVLRYIGKRSSASA